MGRSRCAKKVWRGRPDRTRERAYAGFVAGVDEVGRAPLAGPVLAAAVILDLESVPRGLNDSKRIGRAARERLHDAITASAIAVGIGQASVEEIDQVNIHHASLLAMRRAVGRLGRVPAAALVDGVHDPGLDCPTECVIGGDGRCASIAAASIVAKVTRDRLMTELGKRYPAYGWDRNAGYGVPAHRQALKLVGPSPHHRKTFKPVRELFSQESLLTL